jgi:predicted MFS family arabinose efflux permease
MRSSALGPDGPPPVATGIGGRLTLVLAVACGLAVANIYYPQPLLATIARSFRTGSGTVGLVVTFSQIGFAVGLALILPLGDLLSRRRLVPAILFGTAAALVASSVAPDIAVLIALALVVGLGSVAAQILVPLAAELAGEEERGKVVGRVMSGLLIGILLARTVSGLVAGATSWRVVYGVAAALVIGLGIALSRFLPVERERPRLRYRELLRSTASLFGSEPVLRRRAAYGALGFAAFSVFWTTIAFMLSSPPYRYSDSVIGLFGLVGAAGALCATFAGRLADRGLTSATTVLFSVSIAVSFLPIWVGRHSLVWLIVGIVVLDVGVQGLHVTNQSLIYALTSDARSRVNSAYMVCYFVGGAGGSAIGGVLYDADRWAAVCVLGAGIGVVALIGSGLDRLSPATSAELG